MSSHEYAIEIKNLKFSYGYGPVLNIPSLQIKEGEVAFLYGPSGAGKSTLLELIAGVLQTTSGQLSVGGRDLTKMSAAQLDQFRSEHIGYIFQNFNLIPYLSVTENILLPFLFRGGEADAADLQKLLTQLGLNPYLNRPVSQLSVGQQQRVAVARALIKKPKLILADEPTSALDYDRRESFLNVLFDLCRENRTSVLFVSHDLSMSKLFDSTISLKEINQVRPEAGIDV